MKKVLVCGSRNWRDRELIKAAMLRHGCSAEDILFHGNCAGADLIAEDVGMALGMHIVAFKPNWRHFKLAAGPIRNGLMLSFLPDMIIAFHDDIKNSKGTKNMVSLARTAGVRAFVHSHEDHQK